MIKRIGSEDARDGDLQSLKPPSERTTYVHESPRNERTNEELWANKRKKEGTRNGAQTTPRLILSKHSRTSTSDQRTCQMVDDGNGCWQGVRRRRSGGRRGGRGYLDSASEMNERIPLSLLHFGRKVWKVRIGRADDLQFLNLWRGKRWPSAPPRLVRLLGDSLLRIATYLWSRQSWILILTFIALNLLFFHRNSINAIMAFPLPATTK